MKNLPKGLVKLLGEDVHLIAEWYDIAGYKGGAEYEVTEVLYADRKGMAECSSSRVLIQLNYDDFIVEISQLQASCSEPAEIRV